MTKPQFSAEEHFTSGQAAKQLGICLRTVQLWSDAGVLAASTTVGGHRRFSASAINDAKMRMSRGPDGTPAAPPVLGFTCGEFYLNVSPSTLLLEAEFPPSVTADGTMWGPMDEVRQMPSSIYPDNLAQAETRYGRGNVELTVKWCGRAGFKIRHGRIPVSHSELIFSIRRVHDKVLQAPADTPG